MRATILIILLLMPAVASFAGGRDFYGGKAEGWFWHQDPKERKDPDKKPEPPPPPPKPETQQKVTLTAEWLRENLPKYLDRALDVPTQDNVAAYMYLQRLAVDMSQRFSDQAQAVVVADPVLDESTRRPLASFGASVANEQGAREATRLLKELSKEVGIWFFFQSACSYCDNQVWVQEALDRNYGLKTYPISLDGGALPSGKYPNYVIDQGQSRHLDVIQTPAMFLANPSTGELAPIGQGALALPEMERRILIAAVNAGWITPEMFGRSRPAMGPLLEPPNIATEELQDPNKLIDILRQQITGEQNVR